MKTMPPGVTEAVGTYAKVLAILLRQVFVQNWVKEVYRSIKIVLGALELSIEHQADRKRSVCDDRRRCLRHLFCQIDNGPVAV